MAKIIGLYIFLVGRGGRGSRDKAWGVVGQEIRAEGLWVEGVVGRKVCGVWVSTAFITTRKSGLVSSQQT